MPSPTADHLFQIRPPHQIPISAGGPSPCVPPHHGPTSLSLKELSEHTNDGCFSKNQSETTWWGWLGKIKTCAEIPLLYLFPPPHTLCWLSYKHSLVRWCLSSNSWQLQRSHQIYPHIWLWHLDEFIYKTKTSFKIVLQKVSSLVSMTNWATSYGTISFLKHRITKPLTILSIRTTWVPSCWQKTDMYEFQMHQSHQGKVFFYLPLSWFGGPQSQILSHRNNVGRCPHQTPPGFQILLNRITPIRVWAGTKNSHSVAFLW